MKRILLFITVFLALLTPVAAQINVSTTDVTDCKQANGKATVTVGNSGGLDLEYAVDGGAFQASNTFEKLSAGSHNATVRVKKSSCAFSKAFEIKDAPNKLSVSISGNAPKTYCDTEAPPSVTLRASATGGSGKYEYSWPGGTITVSSSGTQTVTVTDTETGCKASASAQVSIVPVVCPKDPNDIIGPDGYGPGKMIAKSQAHAYMIRFENDPVFATAPAQVVKINHPLDANVNLFSLRLGSFGFGGLSFNVPADKTFYTTRLDVISTLGVVVDVTAGIDAAKKEAFWIFESKDPATGLPPADAMLGMLPVNDSTGHGEGFVTYTIKAANGTQTGDTIHAKASIIFDINAAIETPPIFNTIDAVAPTSRVRALPAHNDSTTVKISWSGADDAGGSGVRDYTLYVSENGGPFNAFQSGIKDTTTSFAGAPGIAYSFFTLATDHVGNQEAMKQQGEASISFCAVEICNGVDDDCDGLVDEGLQTVTYFEDKDGDGYGSSVQLVTCNATVPNGYVTVSGDCDDNNPAVHPGATEVCNGIDDDCDGQIDEGLPTHVYYKDADGDGYGSADSVSICSGTAPAGYVNRSGDCDDNNENTNPGKTEICDNLIDDDCDGLIDEGCNANLNLYFRDADGDGYGNPHDTVSSVSPLPGYILTGGDCNDNNAAIHPGATEVCNGVDDDCDGTIDEGCGLTLYYRDRDGDGYGHPTDTLSAVQIPTGYSPIGGDCNDNNAAIHPGATEIANGIDDNCNGQVDEGTGSQVFYRDLDRDGYGRNSDTRRGTTAPPGYVALGGDCADWDANVHPGAPEIANGLDDNCNGIIDEGLPMTLYYRDVDGDGYGRNNETKLAAVRPGGYSPVGGDCVDWDPRIHPGATEIANGIDDNCDGSIDEGLPTFTYYRDVDNDGFGRDNETIESAAPVPGYVRIGGDCVDWDPRIHPGAAEVANGIDDNCNGQIDEGLPVRTYYRDVDGDGYGRDSDTRQAAVQPAGYVLIGGDCVDWDARIYPGAVEVINGKDDNCNGLIDERPTAVTSKEQAVKAEVPSTPAFNVVVTPIPTAFQFTVNLIGTDHQQPVTIRVYDHLGRVIDHRGGLNVGRTITLGDKYLKGYYILEAIQGNHRKTLKLIKL